MPSFKCELNFPATGRGRLTIIGTTRSSPSTISPKSTSTLIPWLQISSSYTRLGSGCQLSIQPRSLHPHQHLPSPCRTVAQQVDARVLAAEVLVWALGHPHPQDMMMGMMDVICRVQACRYHTSIHIKQSRLLILKLGWECQGTEWVAELRSILSHHMLANRTKCSIQQRQHSRQSRTDNLGMEAQIILQPMLIGLVGSVACHLAPEPSTFKVSTSTSMSDPHE